MPPKLFDRFLLWYCHEDLMEEVQGDLHEAFQKNLRNRSKLYAQAIFVWHVLLFFRPSTIRTFTFLPSLIMWKNYFKMGMRNLVKHTGFSFLNIFGLTIGLATCFIILLWINDEASVNRYHEHGNHIYRLKRNMFHNGGVETTSATPKPVENVLEEEFPEVVQANVLSWNLNSVVTFEDKVYREVGNYVGETFFEMFTFPFLAAEQENPLKDPGNIAISNSLAKKLFGTDWKEKNKALGKMITVHDESAYTLKVAAVFSDVPDNSTWKFDFVLPEVLYNRSHSWVNDWGSGGYNMFVQLKPQTDVEAFSSRIKNMINENDPEEAVELFIQPYEDIHLYGQFEEGKQAGGRIVYLKAFAVVALFIFLIACINFMNLATARSSMRAKEIGIRKTVGAYKKQLRSQFLIEACLLAFISFALSLAVVFFVLPFFNELTDKSISIPWDSPSLWGGALAVSLLMGILAGSYPAFFLSSFKVTEVLTGLSLPRAGSISLRKGLVIFQFIMSNVLIIATLATYQQIRFIQEINLGYDKEQIVYFPIEGNHVQKAEQFRESLLKHPGILKVSAGGQAPTRISSSTGGLRWEGKDPNFKAEVSVISADYGYIETLGMEVIAGRSHNRSYTLDTANILVNEAAAKLMEMEQPVGENVSLWGREGKIIGLLKDFHFSSMYNPIDPLLIRLDPKETWTFFVKLSGENTLETLAYMEEAFTESNPGFPFNYEFLDETYKQTFRSEAIMGRLAGIFSLLAVFISCLGLLGLAAFAAERRTKEMGIRKILGASVSNLVLLLNRDFLFLTGLAFALAVPLAWWIVTRWYEGFAYHSELGWQIFAAAGLFSLLIALGTTSIQSIRVALTNPVEITK